MAITASELETAAVSFAGTALSALLVAGTSLTMAAEVGGVAAAVALGYHTLSGNVKAA